MSRVRRRFASDSCQFQFSFGGKVTISSFGGTLPHRLVVAGLVLSLLLASATGFTMPAVRSQSRAESSSMAPFVPWRVGAADARAADAGARVGTAEDSRSVPNFSGTWTMDLKASDSLLPILSVRQRIRNHCHRQRPPPQTVHHEPRTTHRQSTHYSPHTARHSPHPRLSA